MFQLALRDFHAMQKSGEAGTMEAALEASGAKQLGNIDALCSHERELHNMNWNFGHRIDMVRIERSIMSSGRGELQGRI